jgi:hypothetical protein
MKQQTVEVQFEGEQVGSYTDKDTTYTLYNVAGGGARGLWHHIGTVKESGVGLGCEWAACERHSGQSRAWQSMGRPSVAFTTTRPVRPPLSGEPRGSKDSKKRAGAGRIPDVRPAL